MGLENKTLLDLANETDETKFKEGFSKLPEEDQKKVTAHLTDEALKAKSETVAFRQERQRQEQLAEDGRKKAEADANNQNKSFEQRLRDENLERAFGEVFTELGITKDEDKQTIREQHKKLDTGAMTVENQLVDVRKAVLAAKPDEFLNAYQQAKELQQQADEFNRDAANAGGGTIDRTNGKTYSKEAEQMVRDANKRGQKLNLEEAENYLAKGATRIIR